MARNMAGGRYKDSGNAVQGSFAYKGHQNLTVGATASTSAPIPQTLVVLSATDYFRCAVNGTADATSMILPPGMTPLALPDGPTTISVLAISAQASEISIILPEV